MAHIPNLLSIAGSDPSGGAGIQADLKTFSALGCYGMAVVTALTAQNTKGVRAVHVPPAEFIAAQIDAIFEDIAVDAVKIGMLANDTIARVVADRLRRHKARLVVLDPVLVATSGDSLGAEGVVEAMRECLFPLASLVTPNIPEAMRFAGLGEPQGEADLLTLGQAMLKLGAEAVLVKGGHLTGPHSIDVLVETGGTASFSSLRINTRSTHGTGCTLSSAIAAHLAKGQPLQEAVTMAKGYLSGALMQAERLDVGTEKLTKGHGPVHHFYRWF